MVSVEPTAVDFPHALTAIRVQRDSTAYKDPKDKTPGHYLSSAPIDSRSPEQWLMAIRGHWGGVEIRNHWRKDACLMEDKTRSRNPNIVASLALLRNCLFHYLHQGRNGTNVNAFTEELAADSQKAMTLVMTPS